MDKTEELIDRYWIKLIEKDGKTGLACVRCSYGAALTPQDRDYIATHKTEIIAVLTAYKTAKEEIEQAEKRAQAEHVQALKIGAEKITLSYSDGEYLSGWTVYGDEAKLLAEVGAAKYVDGWGYYIKEDLVKALGQSFVLADAKNYMDAKLAPARAQAQKEADEKVAKFAEAARTNKKVQLYGYMDDCDGSVIDCSTDMVYVYAMPDGTTKTERSHTY